LSGNIFLLNCPFLVLGKSAGIASEHLSGFFICFQLPFEPGYSDWCKLTDVKPLWFRIVLSLLEQQSAGVLQQLHPLPLHE
jgi:hypothetical protein